MTKGSVTCSLSGPVVIAPAGGGNVSNSKSSRLDYAMTHGSTQVRKRIFKKRNSRTAPQRVRQRRAAKMVSARRSVIGRLVKIPAKTRPMKIIAIDSSSPAISAARHRPLSRVTLHSRQAFAASSTRSTASPRRAEIRVRSRTSSSNAGQAKTGWAPTSGSKSRPTSTSCSSVWMIATREARNLTAGSLVGSFITSDKVSWPNAITFRSWASIAAS